MSAIRVLIADDHELFRAGIRLLVQGMTGVELVGEAATGKVAVEMAHSLVPDVILMDLLMPELNGLDATARIVTANPRVHVVILSVSAGEEAVLPALRAGAIGYLVKDVRPAELDLAIRAVARGQTYLCAAVSRHVVNRCLRRTQAVESAFDSLTTRQREVLQLVAEGRNAKEIAGRLGIGVRGAELHRTHIMRKLGIYEVAGLVRYAIRKGLIAP